MTAVAFLERELARAQRRYDACQKRLDWWGRKLVPHRSRTKAEVRNWLQAIRDRDKPQAMIPMIKALLRRARREAKR